MAGFKIGHVTHYYSKLGVAIVSLDGILNVGDKIRLVRNGIEQFTQSVSSIQVEHKKVATGKKGEIVALKLDDAVEEGDELFSIS